MRRPATSFLAGLLLASPALGGAPAAEPPLRLEVAGVERIWDGGEHNAFTDLERFGGRFFCVFREGGGHVSSDGKIRVLESVDGSSWRSAALLESAGEDLRDPKITTTPDGRLMVTGGAAVRRGSEPATSHRSFVAFSRDGRAWRGPRAVGDADLWIWRTTWFQGAAYAVAYATSERAAPAHGSTLLTSVNGLDWSALVPELRAGDGSNEATLRFAADGTCWCLHRRDGPPSRTALLGAAKPPYRDWTWRDLGVHVGGPNFIQLPGGAWIACGRLLDGGARTGLAWLDLERGALTPLLTLPSGGDTSYPGLLWHDEQLWVSYYSSHEGKTSIYLARVKVATAAAAPPAIDIGSRLELFVDGFLIERLAGASLELHAPRPAEVALRFDRPWEGPFSAYVTAIHDGEKYRLYYRGLPVAKHGADEVTCTAESADGVSWSRPDLGLHEVPGSRANNVILRDDPATHNFAPFLDARPGVPAGERFKALGGTQPGGLFAFASADGIHWRKLRSGPVITRGQLDSQNVGFWSAAEGRYLAYFRTWSDGVRSVSRASSSDFLVWSEAAPMAFAGPSGPAPAEQLYTTQTHPYYRAPHIYLAFPMRLQPGRRVLTEAEANGIRVEPEYAGDSTDGVFMTSRGGERYDRTFLEAFVRPGPDPGNWVSRVLEAACGVVPAGPGEMALYYRQHYAQPTAHLRRYTLRVDGFVSVQAPRAGGELVTKPLRWSGKELVLNVATAAAGGVRVEIQDAGGAALPGFALADADEIVGDAVERVATWKGSADVGRLAGRPARLRFVLADADLYSFRFRGE